MSIKTSSIYTSGNDVYFYSDRVKVFPCAYRGLANPTEDDKDIIINPTARLNTEYNFTHLPHMVDKASYIIEFTSKKLICAIHGYYFEIELGTNDSGISDYSILYNKNKYLNICVASPSSLNGENFIEGPHLCSWAFNNTEEVLDLLQAKNNSNIYIFTGLKISTEKLSKGSYQCYALKLDDSAMLPIMANKIEDSAEDNAGVPISRKFTTESISTTSLNAKVLNVKNNGSTILEAHSSGITANMAVQIKSKLTSYSLDVIDGTTPVLKAWSDKVTIHKPTYIKGAGSNLIVDGTGKFGGKLTVTADGADITGDTQIKKSSSGATDGNLTVAGTVGITGKTTIGADKTLTEIENDTIKTSKITIEKASNTGSLVIDKTKNNIIEIKDNSNTLIFSVDTNSGETFAKKINATVEGISDNAVNVTTSINGKSITDIFETNGLVTRKASSLTATSSTNSAGNIIITGNTTDTVDALIPAKTKGRTYNIGSSTKTFDNIYATTFYGDLDGNATTATAFETAASITLEGDVITNTAATGTHDWTIKTTIQNDAVTTDKILDGNVTNDKLAGGITNTKLVNNSITIGSNPVALGGSIGTSDNPLTDELHLKNIYKLAISGKEDTSSTKLGKHKEFVYIGGGETAYNQNRAIITLHNYSGEDKVKATIYTDSSESTNRGRTYFTGDAIYIYANAAGESGENAPLDQGQPAVKTASGSLYAGTIRAYNSTSISTAGHIIVGADLKISNISQIKVKGAGLKSSSLVRIGTEEVYLGKTNCGAIINSNKKSTNATFMINSEKVSGDILQIIKNLNGGATSTKIFNIDCNGNVTANTYNAASDKRLKENIIDYKPEKSILDLPIKKFDFIDGPKNQIGCIAQDLKEICPEIVNENEKGYLSIQENKLVYLLLDEVKKLKNEVEELKRK